MSPVSSKIRKIFTVIIHNTPRDVYDIEGKEHEGYNDIPKTWWLYHSERLPDGFVPPLESEHWKPFHASINRRLWDIKFTQKNTTKVKWDELQFRNHTSVEMWCNSKLIYSFGTTGNNSGLSFAFGKVQYLMVVLSEHCFNFFEPEKEEGRKIYWHGLPATVKIKMHPGEIGIVPDYTCGLSKEEWWKELKRRETKIPAKKDLDDIRDMEDEYIDGMRSDYINWGDALSDGHIDWFRK